MMLRITICLSAPEEINFKRFFCWLELFSSANLIEVIVLEWSSRMETFLYCYCEPGVGLHS